MRRALSLGSRLERPQEYREFCPHHTSPGLGRSVTTTKTILGTEFITILYMSLLLVITNELMCDHGFKKPLVVKEGSSLPLVLDCRTGPLSFHWHDTLPPIYPSKCLCLKGKWREH